MQFPLYFIYYIAPLLGGKKRTLSFPMLFDLIKAPVRDSISRGLDGLYLHHSPSFVIFLFLHHGLSLILLPSTSCSNPFSLCHASPLLQFSSILLPLLLSVKMFFMPWNPFFLTNVSPEDTLCSYEVDITVIPDFMGQEEDSITEQVFASCSKLNL